MDLETRKRLEIRHWVKKVITFFENFGREKALALIADPKGPFVEGERYLFALDIDGELLAHPYSLELVGRNLTGLKDSEGRSFIRKLLSISKNRGYGFVEYNWPVPNSEEELHKTVFFERVDRVILCSGFYSAKSS